MFIWHYARNQIASAFIYVFINFPFFVVLGGGTLEYLQRFLQCNKYVTFEFTPSTALLQLLNTRWGVLEVNLTCSRAQSHSSTKACRLAWYRMFLAWTQEHCWGHRADFRGRTWILCVIRGSEWQTPSWSPEALTSLGPGSTPACPRGLEVHFPLCFSLPLLLPGPPSTSFSPAWLWVTLWIRNEKLHAASFHLLNSLVSLAASEPSLGLWDLTLLHLPLTQQLKVLQMPAGIIDGVPSLFIVIVNLLSWR
jgi:hypothetical protein